MLVKDIITNRIFIGSSYDKEAKEGGAAHTESEQRNRCYCHRDMLDQNT